MLDKVNNPNLLNDTSSSLQEGAKNLKKNIEEKSKIALDHVESTLKNAKKSGEVWLDYVTHHPVQSLLFGAVIGLAIRGLFKK